VKPGSKTHAKHEPHLLQMGLLLSPLTYKLLCPVRRPMTTLDCVLLKDNNRALVSKLSPEISSRACLCVLQGPRHITKCRFFIQRLIYILMFCLENPVTNVIFRSMLWSGV